MANRRPRFLQLPLVLALLTSATAALALQTIEARDGVSVEASIALKEATRIKVDGASITEVFGNIYASNCGGVAAVNRDRDSPSRRSIRPVRSFSSATRTRAKSMSSR